MFTYLPLVLNTLSVALLPIYAVRFAQEGSYGMAILNVVGTACSLLWLLVNVGSL